MCKKSIILIIGIIAMMFFSCDSSKNITGNYYCYFCPKGYITYSIKLYQNGTGNIYTKVIRHESIIDTINWYRKGNYIHIENIDTLNAIFENEYIHSFPSKLLYSNNYILAFQDSSMVLYYKYSNDTLDRDEFYYWDMITSGKQDSIIKVNFGDSTRILNVLSH